MYGMVRGRIASGHGRPHPEDADLAIDILDTCIRKASENRTAADGR
ncbi:hypothetical protein [Streptomyces sp. NBC_01262]|nr:hypothetical protein [Streptomyces sp. NBC_01262]